MSRDTLNRFYVYNALLTRQFDKPVNTYIIYLGRFNIGEQMVQSECVTFKPKVIAVYKMNADEVIERVKNGKGNYIEMALMPLMKSSTEEKIIELVDNEAKMSVPKDLKDDIITATLVMVSTVYNEKLVQAAKRRLRELFDVDIFEKERKEAIQQGLQQGRLETLRKVISKQLISKFKDEYTKEMKEKVKKADLDVLEYISDHIFDITLDEIKKIL